MSGSGDLWVLDFYQVAAGMSPMQVTNGEVIMLTSVLKFLPSRLTAEPCQQLQGRQPQLV